MTKKQLIEELSEYPDNVEVQFSCDFGDYWHTMVAAKITSVSEGQVVWSDYHRMDRYIDPDDALEGDLKRARKVIILS